MNRRLHFSGSPREWGRRFLTVFVVLCLTCAGCREKKETEKKSPPPVLVSIAEVTQKDTPHYLQGIGYVKAFQSVDIRPRITGLLLRAEFKAGDYVTKGQLLFTIDPAPFKAKLKEAASRVADSAAQFSQAQIDFKRFETLYRERTISPEQYEKKELDMKSKKFLLNLRQAELETAQLNLGYCSIVSPLEGQAGDILVDDGNTVTEYQDVLVTIKQVKPIKVHFSLPGTYLPEIRKRSTAKKLEVQAKTQQDTVYSVGDLSLIDNLVNEKTGMIMLEGTFPNPELRLWPGAFVTVRLKMGVTKGALLVPSQAVNDGPKGQYVWRVKKDQTAEIRPVKVNRSVESLSVVSQGLHRGDQVVTEGQLIIYPGARVITKEQLEKAKGRRAPKGGSASGTDRPREERAGKP